MKRGSKRTVWVETRADPAGRVAVKRFHDPGPARRALDRLRAEDERAALEDLRRLGFPVPAVIGVVERAEGVDLVTRWIEGAVTLSDILHGRASLPCTPGKLARALGRLLALAREHGVVHPDLHSGNVLVDPAGGVWLVDVRGVRVRGSPLSREEYAQACITATADVRERMPAALRLRVLVAAQGRDRRDAEEPSLRADARAWNEAARVRRREVVERSRLRWTRASSVAAPITRGGERGYRARGVDEGAAWSALDDPGATAIEGDLSTVREAWWTAARTSEHALPGPCPLAIRLAPRPRAVFAAGAPAVTLGALLGHAHRPRRAAWNLGVLIGRLFDSALVLAGPLETSIGVDARGVARVNVGARLSAADPRDPFGALERAAPLAPAATRREKALFVLGFLSTLELPRRERGELARRVQGSRHAAPRREKLRRRARARLLAGATRAAGLLPHAIVHGALAGMSPLAAFTRAERRTRANLELALGAETTSSERAAIARGVRRHAARQFAEWLRLAGRGARDRWLEDLVEIDPSVALLEGELARGRGALVVTAHIGNWELLAARLRQAGHAGCVVGYRRPNDSSSLWFEMLRERWGVATIPQASHPRTILRALERGLVVGLLADLEVRRLAGEFLPFLGRAALTMTAPAALSRAAGLPLLPARCVFDAGRRRYRLSFEAPLFPDESLARRARTREQMLRLNAVFERWIRADPAQWAWHQPRWRTQPGELEATPLVSRRTGPARPLPRLAPGRSLQSADQGLADD